MLLGDRFAADPRRRLAATRQAKLIRNIQDSASQRETDDIDDNKDDNKKSGGNQGGHTCCCASNDAQSNNKQTVRRDSVTVDGQPKLTVEDTQQDQTGEAGVRPAKQNVELVNEAIAREKQRNDSLVQIRDNVIGIAATMTAIKKINESKESKGGSGGFGLAELLIVAGLIGKAISNVTDKLLTTAKNALGKLSETLFTKKVIDLIRDILKNPHLPPDPPSTDGDNNNSKRRKKTKNKKPKTTTPEKQQPLTVDKASKNKPDKKPTTVEKNKPLTIEDKPNNKPTAANKSTTPSKPVQSAKPAVDPVNKPALTAAKKAAVSEASSVAKAGIRTGLSAGTKAAGAVGVVISAAEAMDAYNHKMDLHKQRLIENKIDPESEQGKQELRKAKYSTLAEIGVEYGTQALGSVAGAALAGGLSGGTLSAFGAMAGGFLGRSAGELMATNPELIENLANLLAKADGVVESLNAAFTANKDNANPDKAFANQKKVLEYQRENSTDYS